MTTNQKVLAGLGLAAAVYVAYRYYKKPISVKPKAGEENIALVSGEAMSNATGTMCKCDNGFVGRCESGDCNKCCGSYNKPRQEQKRYKF
jgi:hypothetical protein